MVNQKSEVISIQQLRGIAAMLVVLHHSLAVTDWLYNPFSNLHFGTGGVDVFFIISGFVMYVAARKERVGEFWFKRILRIVPLYWIATLLYFALRLPHYGEAGHDIASLSKSLFFIPYRAPASDLIAPFLVPGWSLNVEMFFYLIFGVGLAIRRPVIFSATVISLVVTAGLLTLPQNPALDLLSRPILFEFVVGLGFGWLWCSDRIPLWGWPAVIVGTATLLLSDLANENGAVLCGIGAVLIIAGALSAERAGLIRNHPLLRMLGNASYAIYLFHIPTLSIWRKVFSHFPVQGILQFGLFIATALILSALAGIVGHLFIERPLQRKIRLLGTT